MNSVNYFQLCTEHKKYNQIIMSFYEFFACSLSQGLNAHFKRALVACLVEPEGIAPGSKSGLALRILIDELVHKFPPGYCWQYTLSSHGNLGQSSSLREPLHHNFKNKRPKNFQFFQGIFFASTLWFLAF